MSGKKLLLIGGGGHCLSVLDSITGYDEIGIVERDSSCLMYRGLNIVGADQDLPGLFKSGWSDAFITVGSIGNTATRRRLYAMVKMLGFHIPSIIDPSAVVAENAVIEEGCFVGKRAVINVNCTVGKCAIVNTGAIVEHECNIGAFAHISSGATICGNVDIGSDTHIGAGTVIRQGIIIGSSTLIGIGSVVVKDIPSNVKAYGNPCREVI